MRITRIPASGTVALTIASVAYAEALSETLRRHDRVLEGDNSVIVGFGNDGTV